MTAKRVLKIERLADGGLLVELSDGSTARYASASALPSDLAEGLLARMDAAGDAAASRAKYLQRLEQAHQQGQPPDPHQGLTGRELYDARLRDGWRERPVPKQLHSRKHWPGA